MTASRAPIVFFVAATLLSLLSGAVSAAPSTGEKKDVCTGQGKKSLKRYLDKDVKHRDISDEDLSSALDCAEDSATREAIFKELMGRWAKKDPSHPIGRMPFSDGRV